MVQTRSQDTSYGQDWKVVGRHPKVQIPTRTKKTSMSLPIIRIEDKEDFDLLKKDTPAINVEVEDDPALLGNAPRQFYAVSKVFEATRSTFVCSGHFPRAMQECLQVLEALQETICDFISNYCVEGWVPVIPDLKFSQTAVQVVVRELHYVAKRMAHEDQEVAVLEHAAQWGMDMIHGGGKICRTQYSSEVHDGLFEFIRWMLA